MFVVYDVDDKHHVEDLSKQELLGTMECTLAEIMAAGEHLTKSLGLKGNHTCTCVGVYLCNAEYDVCKDLFTSS